jgi:class 3 adenylate cyclase
MLLAVAGPLSSSAPAARGASERRPLTVLFSDIANSTAIVERMDPEDWTEVVDRVFARMNAIVRRYDGTVARLMGDGLLAFFGAPVAHEDDPERAVRCGLDLVHEIDELGPDLGLPEGISLRVRVGINTGPVVVGMVGSDVAQEYTAMGDAVNTAARMQAAAPPGGLLITAATHRFVATLVDATDAGELELKGKTERVHAFEVRSVRAGRATTRGLQGLRSPMIGREPQLGRLREAFSIVQAKQGRVATILGEPGIGKSRLLSELRASLAAADPSLRWFDGRCLSYGRTLPYHLILDLVRSVFGIAPSSDEPQTRAALERGTREVLGESWADAYAYLGHLLSIQLDAGAQARLAALEIETVKRYIASLHQVLLGIASRGPVVVACDDLHWADSASVDLLQQLLPLTADAAVFWLLSSRVDRDGDGWRLITGVRDAFGDALTEVQLEPLSNDDSRSLVANLLAIESLPAATQQLILSKAEGNPFFVEEVIRMLIDGGAIVRDGERWIATERVADAEIPDTLQGLLLARIDRLPADTRRTLRVASVIGRQFGVTVLERLLDERAR